jgi:hypothetical protein
MVCGRRDLELAREPVHEWPGGLVQVREHRAGMAQQGELHGEAEAVGVATAPGHEVLVGAGEGEEPCQAVRVIGHTQERVALLVGQQLSSWQSVPPSHKPPS